MSVHGSEVKTSIKAADGIVKSSAGYVWGYSFRAGATGGAFQLNDSTDDSGTDFISDTAAADSSTVFVGPFDPPIEFPNGIFADVPGTNVTLTVFYT